jgi:hypothetical protein
MTKTILKRSNKILTNNFLGNMGNLVGNATQNKFRGNISNTHKTNAATVALLPGHYPIIGISGSTIHHHNKSELEKAGHQVTTIFDDASVPHSDDQGNVVMSPADPRFTIRSFVEYIRNNAMIIQSMTIHADNPEAYGGNLKIQKTNPFNRPAEIPVELDKFFNTSQYQDKKIDIDFTGDELEISDDVLVTLVVPKDSNVGVTMRFI